MGLDIGKNRGIWNSGRRFRAGARRIRVVAAGLALTTIACAALLGSAAAIARPDPSANVSRPPKTPVYTIPAKIKSDCSAAVETQIASWLAKVPDGAIARFGTNRCYGQDGTLTLTNRANLTIDGNGSQFRALTIGDSHRSSLRFVGGSNLTVQNLVVQGSDPNGIYDHTIEWQHGFDIQGVQGMSLTNVQARQVWGDGINLWRSSASPACGDDASSARNVVISGATIEKIGRQGVAVVDAENISVQNSTIGPVTWANIDLETDEDCEIARHVTVSGNSFGSNGWGVVVNGGFGADPQVGDLTVTNNIQTAPTTDTGIDPAILAPDPCRAPVRMLSPSGVYRSNYAFRGNHFLATFNGLVFRRINNIEVTGNTVAFTTTPGCNSRTGVRLVDSHFATITGNTFTGATSAYSADASSSDITASGNSTN